MSSKTRLGYLALAIFLLGCSNLLLAQNRVAFATSSTGNAVFSSWPQAGEGLTGLAAADSICQARATAANLANADKFIAWMSDSNDDAYCRLHNLTGTKAANCGQAELPSDAGPWVRTDGAPVRPPVAQPQSRDTFYNPLLFDEHGSSLGYDQKAWSSTNIDGVNLTGFSCADWTDPGAGQGRDTPLSRNQWSAWTSTPCGSPDLHLICVETGSGPALEFSEPNENIAFISGNTGNGNLSSWPSATAGTSGIEAGDSICNFFAAQSGLPWQGSYKAWLSDASTDARDRFENDGPRVRIDGIEVTPDLAGLTSGMLLSAIHQAVTDWYSSNSGVWTGTNPDGTANTDHCSGWTSTDGSGRSARSGFVDAGWTSFEVGSCSATNFRLYCISDVDPQVIHSDGFESPLSTDGIIDPLVRQNY
jgi:hypothetical protein